MWLDRTISPLLATAAASRPAILVTGCRQTGKTSLLRRLFPDYRRVSLDVPMIARLAEESPQAFLSQYSPPILIDEVQYAPSLFRNLKSYVDEHQEQNGAFLLAGSQKFQLMQGVTESLAGRVSIMSLHSLSLSEIKGASALEVKPSQILQWCVTGGYPELHAKRLDPEMFYSDYMVTYLERDVRQIVQVHNLRDFERFLRLCAIRAGQMLSYQSLAADVGVSPNTIRHWIGVLEASNIIYLLPPYFRNIGKRLVKSSKLYFLDTGLLCYLLGIRTAADLAINTLLGAVFENLVLGQLVRWYANRGIEPQLFFYRDQQGAEVDFVVPVGGRLILMEAKFSENPDLDLPGMRVVERAVEAQGIISKTVICPVSQYVPGGVGRVSVSGCVDLGPVLGS